MILPVTGSVCPVSMHDTRGGVAVTSHTDTVPSCETQHNLLRSLLANLTMLTSCVCCKLENMSYIQFLYFIYNKAR